MGNVFLALNGKRMNSLEDLRLNFNSDQVLAFYRSGRLQKWLEDCAAKEELETIRGFEPDYDDLTLLSLLMAVFNLSEEQIAQAEGGRRSRSGGSGGTVREGKDQAQEASSLVEQEGQDSSFADGGDSQEEASSSEILWYVCQFPCDTAGKTLEASSRAVSPTELMTHANIADAGLELRFGPCGGILQSFFFDGLFWAKVCVGHSETWMKSGDGAGWEKDEELNHLLQEAQFVPRQIKVTERHVFLLGNLDAQQDVFVFYSHAEGWKVSRIEVRYLSKSGGHSNLVDVYESQHYGGLATVYCWETGFLIPEYHSCYQLLRTTEQITASQAELSQLDNYSDNGFGRLNCVTFKDWLFVHNSTIEVVELSQDNPEFQSIVVNGACLPSSDTVLPLGDIVFIYENPITIFSSVLGLGDRTPHKPICSRNCEEWVECDIDNSLVMDIIQAKGNYYAICKGEEKDMLAIYRSSDGIAWTKIQEIRLFVGFDGGGCGYYGLDAISVGGNDTIILYNKSTTGKYLLGQIQ